MNINSAAPRVFTQFRHHGATGKLLWCIAQLCAQLPPGAISVMGIDVIEVCRKRFFHIVKFFNFVFGSGGTLARHYAAARGITPVAKQIVRLLGKP